MCFQALRIPFSENGFLTAWHYPISPKNGKPALSPHHDWLKTGSQRQNAPLRIWFYPQ
ncbi:transcriptional regulator [Escherichia coli]|uniref:transcriptional regulator n=1 Tax=Escherichia coli TaxID=562 RepID=UPI003DAB98E4